MIRQRLHLAILVPLAAWVFLSGASAVRADSYFLRNATESTIVQVLYPWTQADDCGECCVCWESALATIFAYWDDYTHESAGPWENLYPCGNGGSDNAAGFGEVTETLYLLSDVECGAGSGSEFDWWSLFTYDAVEAAQAYTNELLGYSFSYDFDEVVWWAWDITDYLDDDQPVYFGGSPWVPGESGAHAVTIVGYNDTNKVMYLYDNHHAWLTSRMFDEFTDNARTIDITPQGSASAPASWSCEPSYYATRDGCDCNCGAYDPDCDDPSQTLYNCGPDQYCDCQGNCQDLCTPSCAGRECGPDGCGGSCGSCSAQEHCTDAGRCETSCIPDCEGRECGSDGCGGSCGSCAAEEHCTNAGLCEPDCLPDCTGRQCGPDGCGGVCGTCSTQEHCTDAGRCEPNCLPDCAGRQCGPDGCGGVCGTCEYGWYCTSDGVCIAGCEPNCGGRECGDDGCGGSCGQCDSDQVCSTTYRCVTPGSDPSDGGQLPSGGAGCGCSVRPSDSPGCWILALGLALASIVWLRRRVTPR
ncbi:MAG: hypothetical protein JW797_18860 [Bradymonadales bacterium]|nr:hypothetical protein [Bradymonadales bacterium]